MSLLAVENVHKVYQGARGGVRALRGVSFTASEGEFLAVRGPSGCGKSTLLHVVGGMDKPSDGSVRLGDRRLERLRPDELARVRRREVGFVFQLYNLLPTLTVAENVALPLTLDGVGERQAASRARVLLDQVRMSDRAGHFPAQLSGGEMQRVAVARAVAAEPKLLLADEPTGSLDSESGARVMELLAELNRRLGVTVLLATHSDEAAAYAGRALHMRDGVLEPMGDHERICPTV